MEKVFNLRYWQRSEANRGRRSKCETFAPFDISFLSPASFIPFYLTSDVDAHIRVAVKKKVHRERFFISTSGVLWHGHGQWDEKSQSDFHLKLFALYQCLPIRLIKRRCAVMESDAFIDFRSKAKLSNDEEDDSIWFTVFFWYFFTFYFLQNVFFFSFLCVTIKIVTYILKFFLFSVPYRFLLI